MEKSQKIYEGVVVPMVTPFSDEYAIDIDAVGRIACSIVNAGAAPFVLGSTGEGPSLGFKQKKELVMATVKSVQSRTLIYAGLNANSYTDALTEADIFAEAGVDVLVLTLPYYFPVDEVQITKYFEKIADAASLPVVLYNMPGMVKRSIPLEIAEKLSHHPNIVGMKDSERDDERLLKSISMWRDRKDFSFLIGWAARCTLGLQMGADGIVPSTGNLCPELYCKLYDAAQAGDLKLADALQKETNAISLLYQKDRDLSHSIPALKLMMSLKGLCSPQVLPPMFRMDEKEEEEFLQKIQIEDKKMNC